MNSKTLRVLEYNKVIDLLSEHAVSSLAKEKIIAMQPMTDRESIYKALEETKEAETAILYLGRDPMESFPDIRRILKRASIGSILGIKELIHTAEVLRTSYSTKKRILEGAKEKYPIIFEIASDLSPQEWLYKEIFRCIEDEENISDYASPELSDIRRHMQQAQNKVRDRLNSIIHSPQFQKYLQDPIVTIRNDRYVVPVKQEHRSSVPGIVHDQSSSGATLFVEPMSVVEANNELRELKSKEEHEIERILAGLTAMVEEAEQEILDTLYRLVTLDFIFSKAKFSLSVGGVTPNLVQGQKLKIKNGRHPLIDKQNVVPISVELGYDFDILVITGPNTGGKTVTLKTIGLFILMAQSGLNLPADAGTEIGIFNDVFADIGDEQSIEQSLSTFSSHMTNIVNIIKDANEDSLALFDELGAGTDPTEGAALAMSILDYLNENHIKCAATTHYSELKAFALTRQGMENAAMEFNVETLRPTYRLLIGIPGKSNAFEISRRLGLPDCFIERAKDFISQEDMRFEDIISTIEHDRIISEQQRNAAVAELAKVEHLKHEIEKEKQDLENKKSQIIEKAYEQAKKVVIEAKEEAAQIINTLQKASQHLEDKERNRTIEWARKNLKNNIDKYNETLGSVLAKPSEGLVKPPKNLKLGETVYIVNLDKKGQVLSLPDQNGDVLVQVGIMKVNAHISNLRRAEHDSSKPKSSYKGVGIADRKVSQEVDVRGLSSEDALIETDKFLDDAFLAGLGEVMIIHGKGTGVLRTTIQDHLRYHPHVQSYRLGKYGEGETGVTVVKLK